VTRAEAIRLALWRGFSAEERKEIRRFFDSKERKAKHNEWLRVVFYPPSIIETFVYDKNPFLDMLPRSSAQMGEAFLAPLELA